jgi:hypothetical protein
MDSTTLFRTPSLLKGMARTFDLFGKLDEYKTVHNPDEHAIARDWWVVGRAVAQEVAHYEKEKEPR